jgi:C4-dicarboxylate-specific signal transduction histidine kinase
VPVDESGRPLGWIERTLLAVDSNRVFIEVSDPRLRADLTAEYEAENRDVIVAKDSQTLLKFMEQLPVPAAPANDMVIAGEDSSGETVSDLRRQLKARGWSIPVFTVWAAAERQ